MALTQVTGDGLATSGLPAGSILQVVQSTKLDNFQGQASSITDITGTDQAGSGSVFCCKITPTATSSKDIFSPRTLTMSEYTVSFPGILLN